MGRENTFALFSLHGSVNHTGRAPRLIYSPFDSMSLTNVTDVGSQAFDLCWALWIIKAVFCLTYDLADNEGERHRRIETLLSTILIVTLCATTLMRPGLAEVQTIPGSPIDITKCWSSLSGVQGCVIEIYKSVLTGKFENVTPTCCKAFKDVDAKCWPK
ncbi:unnamed protein product, partial [Thlaspi arvense]